MARCRGARATHRTIAEARSIETLRHALAVYSGELLPGFADEWAIRERERLEAVFDRRMGQLLDGLIAERAWPELLEQAERWIAVGHTPEPAYRARSCWRTANAAIGREWPPSTSAVARTCSRSLGAVPSEQTRVSFEQLARSETVLVAEQDSPRAAHPTIVEAPAAGEAPYQGLQAFDECDSDRFFGREAAEPRALGVPEPLMTSVTVVYRSDGTPKGTIWTEHGRAAHVRGVYTLALLRRLCADPGIDTRTPFLWRGSEARELSRRLRAHLAGQWLTHDAQE